MSRTTRISCLLWGSALSLAACAVAEDGAQLADNRDQAVQALERTLGAPVALEVAEGGTLRVLATSPGAPIRARATDPAVVARDFVAANHALLQLDAVDATQFAATRVDSTPGGLRHVTLNRTYNGVPVFQGAVTVHMDGGNSIFRVLGDESYRIVPPANRVMLSAADAAAMAGKHFGVAVTPTFSEAKERGAVFESPNTLDPIHVDEKIVHVGQGDDRFAYQVTLTWLDQHREQQMQLALIDAEDGALLADYSLIDSFTGRVFHVGAQPTANMTADTRTVVSFDGTPAASPNGWVGAARTTVGNNVVAATDLNANNAVGTNEVQPAASANDSFDFPFNPTQNAQGFRAAAVANAFFLSNDYHDRTYLLGFTETSGNFQTSNFGRGGAQNDAVNVDAQDASGTNNANFGTPPDGQRPRMQMFVFTSNGGATEDGDFDPTVIYHEYSHGLSNRLVGGGSTACLRGIQSGGMGEGWGDFMGATFLNNPVIGAYVTGNTVRGIRRASMASSTFTYANIKDGTMTQVHAAGEIWAASLWDTRTRIGAAAIERLVVAGMKLTPCNPTMLQARDAILSADQQLNGGANRCNIFRAFAGRQMGQGATSPNHNSTTAIVLSTAVPAGC